MKNYYETDPEFMERFENFTFNEVVNEQGQTLDAVSYTHLDVYKRQTKSYDIMKT